MIELFNYLNSLQPLSVEAQGAISKIIRYKELRKGQVWLQEGAVCDKLTFIVKGLMKLYFENGSREMIIQISKEDEFIIAGRSFLWQGQSDYTIRSIEPTVVCYISHEELKALQNRYVELQNHLLSIILKQAALYEQHTALLLLPTTERFEKLQELYPALMKDIRVSDRLLAAFIGVSPNAVCRYRKN